MSRLEPFGPTVLRIALGIVFLAHSAYLKVVVYTMPGTAGYFESMGLPGFAAYAVMVLEVVGGAMLILGLRVRETAAVLAVVALGATWAHSGAGWLFSNEGGGYEYPLFLAAACIAQALMGSGAARVNELTGAA
ncbi:MAG: DoxX family protein [Pseudomonadota bacterium]